MSKSILTIHSITACVLKELGTMTRGEPSVEFEKRVIRSIEILEGWEVIEILALMMSH